MSHQHWHPCAICQTATQHAISGNRVLSHGEVQGLPSEGAPDVSWRCHHHRRCKLRAASVVWANAYGDLCFMLECGRQTQWVFRGEWGYTPTMVERGVDSGQINLDRRQRCYVCGDLESEAKRAPERA